MWQRQNSFFAVSPAHTPNVPFVPPVSNYFYVCVCAGAHVCTFQDCPVHPVHLSLYFSFDRQIKRKQLKPRTGDGNSLQNRRYKRFPGELIHCLSSALLLRRACTGDLSLAGTFATFGWKPPSQYTPKKDVKPVHNTEQTLRTAIGELNCLNPDRPASLDELTALAAARDCIQELLRACVTELRADPVASHSWSTIAYSLGASSASAAQQRYGSQLTNADEQIFTFWQAFAERFTWDFLPADFLHSLYVQWMGAELPEHTPLRRVAFIGRLKAAVTADGGWNYTRSRPGSLMTALEPLVGLVPEWASSIYLFI